MAAVVEKILEVLSPSSNNQDEQQQQISSVSSQEDNTNDCAQEGDGRKDGTTTTGSARGWTGGRPTAAAGGRGGENAGGRGGSDKQLQGGEELDTKVLTIQSKRFYLDVKQNDRGRFIKFAEVAGGGKKSRIFMSMHTSNQFKDHLNNFIDVLDNLKSSHQDADGQQPNLLHSETIVNDKRRYFLDLRENNRGRFLRITQSCTQTGNRFSIALPSQGLAQLRDALSELVSTYGEGYMDEPVQVELPEPRSLRADSKNFYFDPGHNERGDYLKISEVKPSIGIRSSITVSHRALPQVIEILQELQQKMADLRTNNEEENGSENTAEGKQQDGQDVKSNSQGN